MLISQSISPSNPCHALSSWISNLHPPGFLGTTKSRTDIPHRKKVTHEGKSIACGSKNQLPENSLYLPVIRIFLRLTCRAITEQVSKAILLAGLCKLVHLILSPIMCLNPKLTGVPEDRHQFLDHSMHSS